MKRSLFFFLVSSFAVTLGAGCAMENTNANSESASDDAVETSEDAVKLATRPLDVTKRDSAAGLTLITSAGQYRAFFRQNPPRTVDFARHSVVHYSLGMKPTGGWKAELRDLDYTRGVLSLVTVETAPGLNCVVTQAFTNPQTTVRIGKVPASARIVTQRLQPDVVCAPVAPRCPSPTAFCDAACRGEPTETFPTGCPQPGCACPGPIAVACPDVSNYCDLACAGQPLPSIPQGCASPMCACPSPAVPVP